MAIEKNNFKVSRLDAEFSPNNSRETAMSSDQEELQRRSSAADYSDEDDEFDDADSGAGSDDYDLLELGETGAEFCQIGNQTCGVPFELYDLLGLEDILSVDVWNECLSEDEKFGLAKYLPDMDEEAFNRTLKELFTGENFHFGSPIKKLFEMLKGGLCEPRVALYREGLNFFQKRQHYHSLRKHQNDMVSNLCQIRDAWLNCRGYGIEEKLRILNIVNTQKSLMSEKVDDLETDSSGSTGDALLSKKFKDRKAAQKLGRSSAYGSGSNMDYLSPGQAVAMEPAEYGKPNRKGILKTGGAKMGSVKEFLGRFPSVKHGLDMNSAPYGSAVSLPRQSKGAGYGSGGALRMRDQMRFEDAEDPIYGRSTMRDRNFSRGNFVDKSGVLRTGKKHEFLRGEELTSDSQMNFPSLSKNDFHVYSRSKNTSHLPEMKGYMASPNVRASYEFSKNARYPDSIQEFAVADQLQSVKGRHSRLPQKGNRVDMRDHAEPHWQNRIQGDVFPMDSSFQCDDWNFKSKKWKTERESPDLSFKYYKSSSPQVTDRFFNPEIRATPSQEKIRGSFVQNGGPSMLAFKSNKKDEETESDSSEQFDDEEDSDYVLGSKVAYLSGTREGSRSSLKSGLDVKRARFAKENAWNVEGLSRSSKKMDSFSEHAYVLGGNSYPSKGKQKGKMHGSSPMHKSAVRFSEDMGKFNDDDDDEKIPLYKLGRNRHLRGEHGERSQNSMLKGYSTERKHKREIDFVHDYVDDEDISMEPQILADDNRHVRMMKKGLGSDTAVNDRRDRSSASLLGCSFVSKKRKGKADVVDMNGSYEDSNLLHQVHDSSASKRKGKRKIEADSGTPDVQVAELPVQDAVAPEVELETKPQKKPFILITPTVHTGFSFSIMHLLTAIRMAMITVIPQDSMQVDKSGGEQNGGQKDGLNNVSSNENADTSNTDHAGKVNMPALTIQEIVDCVRSNPGDPCILETQEPLNDLVRGVLKIFSSKTAPLGAKGWKALVVYEKSCKGWSWTGPVVESSNNHETFEELTTPDNWGLPHKTLVKLVDSFANWLKSGQETLQQLGSLPAPPASLLEFNLDEKERFRDLRAQKSLNTISPSSEEVREYFRKEEVLRYSIPDRAFSYTAADGKKSIVAPLRRCGGKPTSKARDHFMLKRDRPPHVTILCLVRDAAARLPGSIGTRADVCTLIRDSQYIVEEVSDAQINQVVSGALDRLHYERDPCVQFDGDRKLWVYLHREREEEDFEDDGTSSTKKWKRQKKEPAEQPEQGAVTVAFHGSTDQPGFDLGSDLNTEPPSIDDDKRAEVASNENKENAEDNVDTNLGSEPENVQEGDQMVWETLALNPASEKKLLCQENSTSEDFDDETLGKERHIGLLSAGL